MFLPRRYPFCVLAVLVFAVSASRPASPGIGTTIFEGPRDSLHTIVGIMFNQHRIDAARSPLGNRDLEFHWSQTYVDSFGRYLYSRDSTNDSELDRLAEAACKTAKNPFGFDLPDIQLVVNFLTIPLLGRPRVTYSIDVTSPGFLVRAPYDTLNRNHIDTYVYKPPTSSNPSNPLYDPVFNAHDTPADSGALYAKFPSDFRYTYEDTSSGRAANLNAVLPDNTIQLGGPLPGRIGVFDSLSWSQVNGGVNAVYMHEFQHCLNEPPHAPTAIREMGGMFAEALVGEHHPNRPFTYDVPYTWSFLGYDSFGGKNYYAWRSFGSYLASNFQGVDKTAGGIGDDLIARWAAVSDSNGLFLRTLGQQLMDSACVECRVLPYLSGLSNPQDRLDVIMHNWRVATYVNDTSIVSAR